jgi:hypothetical protein
METESWMELVIENSQTTAVTEEALAWPEKARAHVISDGTTYQRAADLLVSIKALRGEVNATFDPIIADAHKVHKTACDKKRVADAPLLEAETILKRAMADFNTEQERIRLEEERRLEAEARKREEDRRIEEAAALEREAIATDSPELHYEATQLIEQPVVVPPVQVAKAVPKVAGIVHRENWSARVVSLVALVKFVAAHPEHQNLLMPNTAALNSLARAMKSNLKIDGVQAVNTPTVAASR